MKNCEPVVPIDNKNNGLITKIWGGPGWIFNHSVTFGYPIEPTPLQREEYRQYFTSLGHVLPCRYCRESYQKFISEGPTKLTDEVLKNRDSLTRWMYDVHQAVNAKLEVDYGITYEDTVDKYESFRAKCGKPVKTEKGCVAPLDYKAFSFKRLYYMDAPIISYQIALQFKPYAIHRGLQSDQFVFLDLAKAFDGEHRLLKTQPSWIDRNMYCQHQIRHMRENAVMSVETEGEFEGLPTIDELKLIMFMSSNLNRTEMDKALRALEE